MPIKMSRQPELRHHHHQPSLLLQSTGKSEDVKGAITNQCSACQCVREQPAKLLFSVEGEI